MTQFLDTIRTLVTDPDVAGIEIRSEYDATGVTVTPPAGTISDGDGKMLRGLFDLPDGTKGVTLDSWGSQAHRWSAALSRHADDMCLPAIRLTLPEVEGKRAYDVSTFDLSHRHTDVVFRVHGEQVQRAFDEADSPYSFDDLMRADITHADALLRWFPQSILCGWWDSHFTPDAKKRDEKVKAAKTLKLPEPQNVYPTGIGSKSARAMTSEIIARNVALRTRYAAKVDPIFGAMPGKGIGGAKFSELGFGSIPPAAAPKDVTFESIEGLSWISLTTLRRFGFHDVDRNEALTALVTLALAGLRLTRNETHLRSGSDLILRSCEASVRYHGRPSVPFALPGYDEVAEAVRTVGAPLGWAPIEVDLSDSKNLKYLLDMSNAADES